MPASSKVAVKVIFLLIVKKKKSVGKFFAFRLSSRQKFRKEEPSPRVDVVVPAQQSGPGLPDRFYGWILKADLDGPISATASRRFHLVANV